MKAPRSLLQSRSPFGLKIKASTCCSKHLFSSPSLLQRSSIHTKRKLHATAPRDQLVVPQTFIHDYFSANNVIDRGWLTNSFIATTSSLAAIEAKSGVSQGGSQVQKSHIERNERGAEKVTITAIPHSYDEKEELPHRRRKRLKEEASSPQDRPLPFDASSQLTTAATNLPASAVLRRRFATYLSLAKPRLSFLIILTTTSAYSLYPIPDVLSSQATADAINSTLSTSTLTLLYLTLGTFLSSASANTLNMLFEPKQDALMVRTRNRPLVRKLVGAPSAAIFATVTGLAGLTLLHFGTNPTVAALSALNIFLYAGVYTPMKRLSSWNTWVGAVVGAIPPLMGWGAAAGQAATAEHHSWQDLLLCEDATGGWLLAALLFAWQFPHFNSLSHGIREDYKRAGHKMLCWMNPRRNGRVALRYSILMFPICGGLWWAGYVNSGFAMLSTMCNVWMTREAFRFWRDQGGRGSARGLFWASVWQLPLVLIGALVCKAGVWGRLWEEKKDSEDFEVIQAIQEDTSDATNLLDVQLARSVGPNMRADQSP
ncbi:MAG: hypothetical protein Q9227_000695 [Pyrenula ochraceoflavens]